MKRLTIICGLFILLLVQLACQSTATPARPIAKPAPALEVKTLPAPAITPQVLPASLKELLVLELIGRLGDDDWQTRETASRELILACELLGETSLALIKSALAKTSDAEVQTRLKQLLTAVNCFFGNIIINSSFEDGLNGWKCVENWNGSKIKLVKAEAGEAPDGNHYLEMWHDPAKGDQMWSSSWSACGQKIQGRLKPGELYELSLWYKTSHPYAFRMSISDAELTMHSSLGVSVGAPKADGKWHEAKGTIKVTQDQLNYEPFLTLYYDYMAPGVIWFDKINLEKVKTTEPAEKDR